MQTEYQFKLPKGYRSEDGSIHKEGFMRLATAKDEIEASRHPKAKAAPEYATIILLSKVIVKLDGTAPKRSSKNMSVFFIKYRKEGLVR